MPKKQTSAKKSLLAFNISIGRVSLTEKALFAKHMSLMLRSGLTVVEAVDVAIQSSSGKLKKVLYGVLKSIKSGNTLSESLGRYSQVFSGPFVASTHAGETSGTLDENMKHLADQLEKEKDLASKIKGAMLYPIVVLIAAFVLGMAVSFLILPKITPLFEGLKMDIPFTTRGLIWFSHFIQDHGVVLFVSIIISVVFLIWFLRKKIVYPVTHWLFLHTPVVRSVSLNANLARFCRTLGMLLKGGLNIDEALLVTRQTMINYYYQKSLEKVSLSVDKGRTLSDNLLYFQDLYPVMVINMIKVGEQSGNLEETLLYLSDFYEAEVDTATKSLSTIIEPALLIFIGLLVGFLALSIITPIYNITSGINK
ncbi:MAG: type II secretion system F family protein [bacterium]